MDVMNKRTVMGILAGIWIVSAALAYGPIFTDVYTNMPISMNETSWKPECNLIPNRPYAIISSSITFWLPGVVMILIYTRVFIEANRQEKAISSERKRLQVYTACMVVVVTLFCV